MLNMDRESPPLYLQIKALIKHKIDSGEWQPGEKIPSELELCEILDVSRTTVREAINELVWEEYLVRHRAKGTFVLETKKHESDTDSYTYVKSFTYEMSERGQKAETIHAQVSIKKADAFLSKQLEVPKGTDLLELKRVRGIEKEILVYSITYLNVENFSIDSKDYYGSLYEMLKEKGIHLTKMKEYLEAVQPDEDVQNHLQIEANVPVLKRVRHSRNESEKMIEFSRSFYVGERYRYYIELTSNG